jgi:hypothetical protein
LRWGYPDCGFFEGFAKNFVHFSKPSTLREPFGKQVASKIAFFWQYEKKKNRVVEIHQIFAK